MIHSYSAAVRCLACLSLILAFIHSPLAAGAQGPPDIVWSKGVGHPENVAYSADGSVHAIFSRKDNTNIFFVRIVRSSDGKLLHTYPIPTTEWYFFALSPDGQFFAVGSNGDRSLHLFRVADGTEAWSITEPQNYIAYQGGTSSGLAFSADSTKLIYGRQVVGGPNTDVVVRSTADGSQLFTVPGIYAAVNPAANEIAVADHYNGGGRPVGVDFYDLNSGTLTGAWGLNSTLMEYSGDGQFVVLYNHYNIYSFPDYYLYAYRRSDQTLLASIYVGGTFTWLAYSGSLVYVAYPGSISAWDVNTGSFSQVVDLAPIVSEISQFSVSSDGQQMAIPGTTADLVYGRMYYCNGDGTNLRRDDGMGGTVDSLAMAPDGLHFATASGGSPEVQIWETLTGTLTARYTLQASDQQSAATAIYSIAWSQDNDTVAVCSSYPWPNYPGHYLYSTQLISAADGHVRSILPTDGSYSTSAMTFVSNGSRLVSSDGDGYVRLWDVTTASPALIRSLYLQNNISLAYCPLTDMLAIGRNAYVDTWSSDLLTFYAEARTFGYTVDVAFTQDGSKLSAGAQNAGTVVFNVGPSSLTQIHAYSTMAQDNFYQPVAFDPISTRYLARSYRDPNTGEASLGIFDTANPDPANDSPAVRYNGEIGVDRFHATRVAYTPDARYIVYTVANGNVVVAANPYWDGTPPVTTAALSPAPNGSGWNNGDVTVTLTATDAQSGVQSITYSASGAQTIGTTTVTGASASFTLTAEGTTTVTYHATDNAGNVESDKTVSVMIDKTAPATTGSTAPSGNNTQVTLTATDALSGVAQTVYSVDGGAAQTYAGPFIVTGAGDHTVTFHSVDVAGNVESDQSIQFTQGIATTLTVNNASGVAGQRVTLSAKLKRTSNNANVPGETIVFKVDGAQVGTGTTNTSGTATFSYTLPETVGTHGLTAEFGGDATYKPSNGSGTLTISQAATALTVPSKMVSYADTVNLTGTLRRVVGNTAVAGQSLTFSIDGVAAGTAVTNASGTAALGHQAFEIPGSHAITVDYAGSAAYSASSGSATLTVSKANTKLTVSNASGKRGTVVMLKAKLKRTSDGTLLPGMTIAFTVAGTSAGSAVTDSTGTATLSYTIDPGMTTGAKVIQCDFAGDANHNPSTDTGTLTVK